VADKKGKRARKPLDRTRKSRPDTVWLFGIHAVREALENPMRVKLRLILTKNASDRLAEALKLSDVEAEIVDPRKFSAPLDPQSVHQGAAIEVKPLDWGSVSELCAGPGLRELTKETCTELVRITASGGFGSLNVSNAAAVALYAARKP